MPHVKPAFDFLESKAPEFKEKLQPRSLLYVGWRHDAKPWWYDSFGPALGIQKFGILEVFPKNHSDFEQLVWSGRYSADAILGDVRRIDSLVKPREWDIIFWDHGPEHVTWEDLQACTPKIFSMCGKMLLYSAPWGEWPQGIEDNNEHEVHRNSVTVEQFKELGLETTTFGGPSQGLEGELCGWKLKHALFSSDKHVDCDCSSCLPWTY